MVNKEHYAGAGLSTKSMVSLSTEIERPLSATLLAILGGSLSAVLIPSVRGLLFSIFHSLNTGGHSQLEEQLLGPYASPVF